MTYKEFKSIGKYISSGKTRSIRKCPACNEIVTTGISISGIAKTNGLWDREWIHDECLFKEIHKLNKIELTENERLRLTKYSHGSCVFCGGKTGPLYNLFGFGVHMGCAKGLAIQILRKHDGKEKELFDLIF